MQFLIVGLPRTGKSTLLRSLASDEKISSIFKLIDLDQEIEKYLNVSSLSQWILENGIAAFRSVEAKLLKDYLQRYPELILSLGGGALDIKLLNIINQREIACFVLSRPSSDILNELVDDKTRPHHQWLHSLDLIEVFEQRMKIFQAIAVKIEYQLVFPFEFQQLEQIKRKILSKSL
jgi:shikimate kinase